MLHNIRMILKPDNSIRSIRQYPALKNIAHAI